jgi:hypothetical protein
MFCRPFVTPNGRKKSEQHTLNSRRDEDSYGIVSYQKYSGGNISNVGLTIIRGAAGNDYQAAGSPVSKKLAAALISHAYFMETRQIECIRM